ncbi:MAG: hypothetical protein U0990_00400 [Candidatus Nanopelagicales bacterium]|nr:hypothetical protein [Candidatus Nanopelagicales bacterium]MDZ4248534.1 hypothetical protein [Candidatus Nanopelagicales bacterium]
MRNPVWAWRVGPQSPKLGFTGSAEMPHELEAVLSRDDPPLKQSHAKLAPACPGGADHGNIHVVLHNLVGVNSADATYAEPARDETVNA